MNVIYCCAVLALFVVQTFADSTEPDLRLEVLPKGRDSFDLPCALYLCNYSTSVVTVTTRTASSGLIKSTNSAAVVVQLSIPTNWYPQVTVGTNTFVTMYGDEPLWAVTLHYLEAMEVGRIASANADHSLPLWWKSLPTEGTISFVYDVPKAYGSRFGVWSGRLESKPFPIRGGNIVFSPDSLAPTTTVGVVTKPVAAVSSREDATKHPTVDEKPLPTLPILRGTAGTNAPIRDVKPIARLNRDTSGVLSDEDYYASVLTGKTTNEVLAALSPLTNQLATVKAQVDALKKERDDLTKAYNQNRDPSLERQLSMNGFHLRVREREVGKVERRVAIVERYLQPTSPPDAPKTQGSNQVPEDTVRKLADPQH